MEDGDRYMPAWMQWVRSSLNTWMAWSSSSSVQLLSHVRLFVTPWIAAHQACLSITNSRSLLKLMSIMLVMPSSHLILCCPCSFCPHGNRTQSKKSDSCILLFNQLTLTVHSGSGTVLGLMTTVTKMTGPNSDGGYICVCIWVPVCVRERDRDGNVG